MFKIVDEIKISPLVKSYSIRFDYTTPKEYSQDQEGHKIILFDDEDSFFRQPKSKENVK